jgi:hypothetical protein
LTANATNLRTEGAERAPETVRALSKDHRRPARSVRPTTELGRRMINREDLGIGRMSRARARCELPHEHLLAAVSTPQAPILADSPTALTLKRRYPICRTSCRHRTPPLAPQPPTFPRPRSASASYRSGIPIRDRWRACWSIGRRACRHRAGRADGKLPGDPKRAARFRLPLRWRYVPGCARPGRARSAVSRGR